MANNMIDNGNIRKSDMFRAFLPLIILMLTFFAAGTYSCVGFFNIVKYLLVQIFVIFIPGAGLYLWLEDGILKSKDFYRIIFLSYILGYSAGIIIYIIFLLLRIQFVLPVVCVIYALAALFFLYSRIKKDGGFRQISSKDTIGWQTVLRFLTVRLGMPAIPEMIRLLKIL